MLKETNSKQLSPSDAMSFDEDSNGREQDFITDGGALDFGVDGDLATENDFIPGTDSGCDYMNVNDLGKSFLFPCHVLLNHCGSLMVRKEEMRRSAATKLQRAYIQRLVACEKGDSIPLLYPEAMIFNSLF